jgi:uncharacterized membrane-anchored protein
MIRIILFLLLIALGAAGAAWIAEQPGDVMLSWGSLKLTTKLPVFVLGLGIVVVAAMMLWAILRGLWRTIRWRCCCMRSRRSSTATAKARSAPSAPWPSARTRDCWACAACSSRRSAPTIRWRR